MGRTTIRDIAEMAGVCIATVSRVINNKDNVLPEMRQRILALIEQTGYQPNAMGRGLVLRRSHNILLEHFSIADPYWVALAGSVTDCCRTRGYRMLLADCKFDATLEAEHLSRVRDGSADGLIVSPLPGRQNVALFRELARSGFPVVLMDNAVPGVRMNCVKYDDHLAGTLAMDYLFGQGHERIAFVQWHPDFHTVRDRRRSFLESYGRRGMTPRRCDLVTMPDSFHDWQRSVFERILSAPKPPTAVLTENEEVGVVVMNMLLQCGVRIPEDIALMAIGDTLLDSVVPVPLTTVSLHPEQAAVTAVELLVRLIEDEQQRRAPPRVHIQTPSLVVRKSA